MEGIYCLKACTCDGTYAPNSVYDLQQGVLPSPRKNSDKYTGNYLRSYMG